MIPPLIAKKDTGRRKTAEWSGPADEEYTALCQEAAGIIPGRHADRPTTHQGAHV